MTWISEALYWLFVEVAGFALYVTGECLISLFTLGRRP